MKLYTATFMARNADNELRDYIYTRLVEPTHVREWVNAVIITDRQITPSDVWRKYSDMDVVPTGLVEFETV